MLKHLQRKTNNHNIKDWLNSPLAAEWEKLYFHNRVQYTFSLRVEGTGYDLSGIFWPYTRSHGRGGRFYHLSEFGSEYHLASGKVRGAVGIDTSQKGVSICVSRS
jgi:hypothetical protein